jgi:hypothetical protein
MRKPLGLTLVEMLLATTMMATLVVSLAGLLPETVTASRKFAADRQPDQTARAILALVARDLRCTLSTDVAENTLNLAGSSAAALTDAAGSRANTAPARISYRLAAGGSGRGKRLWRFESGAGGDGMWSLVAEGVAEFGVADLQPAQARRSRRRQATGPIRAVKITIRMVGQDAPLSRSVILPIALNRLPEER